MHNIIFFIACGLAIINGGMIWVSSFYPIIPSRRFKIIFTFFFFGLALFSFFAEPSVEDDLYRHFKTVEGVRNGTAAPTPLIIWRLLCLFVALCRQNGFLPLIAVIIAGTSLYEIMKCNSVDRFTVKIYATYIVCFFGLCSIFWIVSGVRNATAFAIWSMAYFRYYKKNKAYFYVFCVMASLIHLAPLLPTAMLIFSEYYVKLKKSIRYFWATLLFFWPTLLQGIAGVFSVSPVGYLRLIALKINGYYNRDDFYQNPWYILLYINIALFSILLWLTWKNLDHSYRAFLFLFMICTIASAFQYEILLDRMMILVGYISLPIIIAGYSDKSKIRGILYLFRITNILMFAFTFNSMIAHMTFNGINIYKLLREVCL